MAWKKVSQELTRHLDNSLSEFDCQSRKMFGCPVYFTRTGNMFAGVHQDSIMIRLSEQDRNSIFVEVDGVVPFEPMEGRIMKEYVVLPESIYFDDEKFKPWLERSFAYAMSIPEKKQKKKRNKK